MFQMIWFIFQFCHWVIIMKYMKVWPSQIELYFKFHKTEKQLCKSMFETKTTFQLIYKCMFKNTKEKKKWIFCVPSFGGLRMGFKSLKSKFCLTVTLSIYHWFNDFTFTLKLLFLFTLLYQTQTLNQTNNKILNLLKLFQIKIEIVTLPFWCYDFGNLHVELFKIFIINPINYSFDWLKILITWSKIS